MSEARSKTSRLGRIGVLAAAAITTGLLAWAFYPTPETPASTPATATASADPAQAWPADTRFFRELGHNDPEPDTQIALTDNQELIADSALRDTMDFYLLKRHDDGRLQALTDYLHRKLPPGAAKQAEDLAVRYNAYIAAHDKLLAAQNFGATQDVQRLLSWQRQRQQLRDRMLGERVAEAWFGNEEAYLTQALEELRQRRDGEVPETAPNADDQAAHDQHMQQVVREAVSGASAALEGP